MRHPENHLANMDLLRALAVLAVLGSHVQAITGYPIPFFGAYGGLAGVQLFFLASGYLITQSLTKNTLREYAIHRFFRIFPAYWFAYLAFGLLSRKFTTENMSWGDFFLNIANLQQISPTALISLDVLSVSWTLTVELFWYFVAPLFALRSKRTALWWLAGSIVISSTWVALGARGFFDNLLAAEFAQLNPPATPNQISIVLQNAFPAQLVFFIFGGCLYFYRENIPKISETWLTPPFLFLFPLSHILIDKIPGPNLFTGIMLSIIFIKILRMPPTKDRVLPWIGKISYSIYLTHVPVIVWCMRTLQPHIGMYYVIAAVFITLAISAILHEFLEKPCIAIGKKLTQKKPAPRFSPG